MILTKPHSLDFYYNLPFERQLTPIILGKSSVSFVTETHLVFNELYSIFHSFTDHHETT